MGSISFNSLPADIRTPGVYTEIDNSRALKGLVANPHKVLLLGQKLAASGTIPTETLVEITSDGLANGYFGAGSHLARMCHTFKANNPKTEVWALAVSLHGGIIASGNLDFSAALAGAITSVGGRFNLMVNGKQLSVIFQAGDSGTAMASRVLAAINADSNLPVYASMSAVAWTSGGRLQIRAVCSGSQGNNIQLEQNYYGGQFQPCGTEFSRTIVPSCWSVLEGGDIAPTMSDVWAVADGQQFHYIVCPYDDRGYILQSVHNELSDRFQPQEDMQGHCFAAVKVNTLASATAMGNSLDSPFITFMPAQNSPAHPSEWAAALGAIAAYHLHDDPARPLHYLKLKGWDNILTPRIADRWTRFEREASLLYDGCATFIIDTDGDVAIERCITTYQTNALGIPDASYLDVQTLATLGEIRYQFKNRMLTRFIYPRFKLADDTFPVQPGSHVATPKTVKQEIIALFTELRDKGLIENLSEFIANLVVERNESDVNQVDALMAPDLINQFRILAGLIQFIL